MSQGFDQAARLLPGGLRDAAAGLPAAARETAEEFRLRAGRPPTVLLADGERALRDAPVTSEELRTALDTATASSFHAVAQELRQGFFTARGGVRVGVCGSAVCDGPVRALRDISSLALRIPRQIRSAGREAFPLLAGDSVLILSPPGGGKTTLLRELVRTVSDQGVRVGLADERGEIAAVWDGQPRFDVGRCTDVITGAPKAEAALMLLRAMNPQVIAMDEISAPADAAAVARLRGCGVRVFATVHAAALSDLQRRPLFRRLLSEGMFTKAVTLTRQGGRACRVAAL